MRRMTLDHNSPIVELYLAEFDTDEGPTILECWSMEPTGAAIAFREFFTVDHPNRSKLTDQTRLKTHPPSSEAWHETWNWWLHKPDWTGDYVELAIDPGTQMTIGKTVLEYVLMFYVYWSKAYSSRRNEITRSMKSSLRTNAGEEMLQQDFFRPQSS